MVFLTDKESNKHNGVEFHKNGKKAFGLKFNNTDSFMSSIGFMVPLDDYKNGFSQRFIYKGIYNDDIKDIKFKGLEGDWCNFEWVDIKDLHNYKFYPEGIDKIIDGSSETNHFVNNFIKE